MKNGNAVLVVDDDSAGRAMISLFLRQHGFQVRTAASGAEALRLLSSEPSAWLVTDARMQPMTGFELAVKARQAQPDIRIVMVSALYTSKDVNGYPVDKFFPKPVPIDDLVAYLKAETGPKPAP